MENLAFVGDTPAPANYGSTTSNAVRKVSRTTSVTYCVHGKVAANCCDGNSVEIKTVVRSFDTHCHNVFQREEGIDKDARKKLIIASVLCVLFMIVEIIGGTWSNSLAIATDAAHLLADLASFMISLLAIYIASRRSTKRMSFGFHRAEVIGAITSVLMIWIVTAILVYMAILRIHDMNFEVDGKIMLITSGIGILVNLIMGCSLHDHGHGHGGHGHSHSPSPGKKNDNHGHSHAVGQKHSDSEIGSELPESAQAHKHQNINVRAAMIHVISDFVQSCGVFIAALIIFFHPDWKIIDPICTFLFSILVLATTINIMKDAILVIMEATPEYLDYTEIMETFLGIPGVVRVHNLRIWALSVNKIALAAHLAVQPNTNAEAVLKEATLKIHAKYEFYETTLQIEEYDAEMEACKDCNSPA